MGAYCRYCDQRCFVERRLPDDAKKWAGETLHMATCDKGAEHDRESTGYDYATAINPRAPQAPAPDPEKWRPPVEDRWVDGMRTEPGTIAVRTRWRYSEPDPRILVPPGRTRHPFGRGGRVTASDWPWPYEHMQDVASHVWRAIGSFGDDKDLVIEVRLADPQEGGE